jgi:acetyl/propionyl-CoA carboxylase alpha subunit/acetyl-CoA carboxylase carboxyltransferase component
MRTFNRLAILARGAPARRASQACRELDPAPRTIVLHAGDAAARFVREADEALEVRAPDSAGDELERALAACHADAVWPGWGPAARSPELAALCADLGIGFVGASAEALRRLADPAELAAVAHAAGFTAARRLEVLIAADRAGHRRALAVADLSLGTERGPAIVECPAAELAAPAADALAAAAVVLSAALALDGVLAIEVRLDAGTGRFELAAVHPHLPPHHAVYEAALGRDLAKLAIQLAAGGALDEPGAPEAPAGHAMLALVTARDPDRGLQPVGGAVTFVRPATGPGIRFDAAVGVGDRVAAGGDPLIAAVTSHGRDRAEALARLEQALRAATIVFDAGATDKGWLVELCGRPEVRRGPVGDGWAAARLAGAPYEPAHTDVALLAVAIEAYRAARAEEDERFIASARRGRPRLTFTGDHGVSLRCRGASYDLAVAQTAPDTYQIALGGNARCELHAAPLDDRDQLLTVSGRRYRVLVIPSAAGLAVEVDGVPHHVEPETRIGVIRAPTPAVVLGVPAAPGDEVAAGGPLVVLEAMKMAIRIDAPEAVRVRQVLVAPSVQVDLDTPLVVYERLAVESAPLGSACVVLPADPPAPPEPARQLARARAEVRRLLLGFDADAAAARAIVAAWKAATAAALPDDPTLLAAELEILRLFADLQGLQRRQPSLAEPDDDAFASAQEHLCTYLRELDERGAGLPASFHAMLLRALAHHGVRDLADSPALRAALVRIFKSHERAAEQALLVAAILDRRLAQRARVPGEAGDPFHIVLNALIAVARRRFGEVHELALRVREALFDLPLYERARDELRRSALRELEAIDRATAAPGGAADPARSDPRIDAPINALVECPQPLLPLLAPLLATASAPTRAAMLEVLTRRFYRPLGLAELAVAADGEAHVLTARYSDGDGDARLIATYAPRAGLAAAVRRLAPELARAGRPARVVVDVYSWSPEPLGDADDDEAAVRAALAEAGLPPGLGRITVTTAATAATAAAASPGGDRALHGVTCRADGAELALDRRYRGIHPMIARRLRLDQFDEFELERLDAVEDVYLYRGVARANRKDERLFALAEVRDLTPVRDAAGQIVQLPYLERVLGEALAELRRVQAQRPARERLQWNRVVLHLWEPLALSPRELDEAVRRLAPATEGLGIEQVEIHARMPEPGGAPRERCLHITTTGDGALHVRIDDPPRAPIRTLTEYEQKVIALRRRGLIYPYELIRMITPAAQEPGGFPPGAFVEHDLDAAGALVPVDRPPGANTAHLVVGVITHRTAEVPEGMTRVILLGDAHHEMGSLAEPECRRIIAALDLAERMGAPLEWFALSAGAKISRTSGTENMDWISAVLRRIVRFTQRGGELNVVVCGINVGAQPYWNAEATMLMHTRGVLIMVGDAAMVLTGKQALDYSGSTSAEDNQGIGGYERVMGPNGQAQYWAPDVAEASRLLLRHYAHTYVVPGERFPRRAATADPRDRDACASPHPGPELRTVGDVLRPERNPDRKRPFDIRAVMRAVADADHEPLERWRDWRDAEIAVVWDARLGGVPVCMLGFQSHALPRHGRVPADGPVQWTSGTLFPRSSKKIARAINAASGNRPLVVLANLAGFDGSPESMREWQLEFGAEIGRAVVNFDGPIVFCVVSRYHGGAFVVFSKQLNDQMEVFALEGTRASVIGGAPAAAVVFARDVEIRTAQDPRLAELERALAAAPPAERAALREQRAALRPLVYSEKLGEVADEFDHIHSVERALATGSLDRIIAAASLRPALIDAVERGMARAVAGTAAASGARAAAAAAP